MMDEGLPELPKGWVWATVGGISRTIHYGYTASSSANQTGPKFLRITDIQNNSVDWDAVPYCKIDESEKGKYLLKEGDLVFARTGATVGKSFLIRGNIPETVFASYLIRIILDNRIDTVFISNFFQSINYWSQIHKGKIGIGQPNVNAQTLSRIAIPLPPLPEQQRIVAKIEEFFTKLDAGIEALKKIKAQLKRYRQAVLKYAFEGKLTQEWREANNGKIEPASVLLERIKEERKKDTKGKFKELPPLEASQLSELPEGWAWTKVGEIGLIISGQTPKELNSCGNRGEIPFYKVNDMNRIGNERFMKDSEICLTKNEVEKLKIHIQRAGTVIFPKRGGAIATNKKRILSTPSAYDLNIMGVYPLIMPFMYFYYWISSLDLNTLSDGSNVPQINHKDIEPLPFPLPSLEEQQKIVEGIESRLSVADEVEKVVEQSSKQSDRLRQSILKQAFEGKLIPQDPSDEPAERLLERIKIEKTKLANESKIKSVWRKRHD